VVVGRERMRPRRERPADPEALAVRYKRCPLTVCPQRSATWSLEALGAALASDEDVAFAFLHGSFVLDVPFRDVDLAVFFAHRVEHPTSEA